LQHHFVLPGNGLRITFSTSGGTAAEAAVAAPIAALLGSLGGMALRTGGGMAGDDGGMLSYEALLALGEQLGGVSRGATEAQVAALPTRRFAPGGSAGGAAEETCSICLSDFEAGDELRALPCAHAFHCACIDQWLKSSRACPCCRHEMA
jgi:hypothetical protein